MCFCSFVYHFSACAATATQHRTSIKILSLSIHPFPACLLRLHSCLLHTQWVRSISRLVSSSSRFHLIVRSQNQLLDFSGRHLCCPLSCCLLLLLLLLLPVSALLLDVVVVFGIPGKAAYICMHVCVLVSLSLCTRVCVCEAIYDTCYLPSLCRPSPSRPPIWRGD